MKVGFTGTQKGMTLPQKANLRLLLIALKPTEFHHGDCVGSDAEAHAIATELKIPIVVHPPSNPVKRAHCAGAVLVHPPLAYLVRDKNIVDGTEVMTAAPDGRVEQPRSGTWFTVRHARKRHRIIWLLYPDGTVDSNAPLPVNKGAAK